MSDCGRQHRYERGVEAQLGNSPDHRPLSWLCTTSRFYHTFSFTFSVHHRDACMNVILRSVQVTLVIVHVQHQHQRAAEPEAETPRAFCCFKVLLVLNRVKHSLTFLVRRKYPMAVTLMRTLWVTHTQRERERERERERVHYRSWDWTGIGQKPRKDPLLPKRRFRASENFCRVAITMRKRDRLRVEDRWEKNVRKSWIRGTNVYYRMDDNV